MARSVKEDFFNRVAAQSWRSPHLARHHAGSAWRCLHLWAVGPSALPCAGVAPPQRPPTKPSLTDRAYSSPASCLANRVYSPTCRLNPPPTDLQSQKLLTPAVPRPRNAPLQNHPSPTVLTLPQHRVWRTESTPPLAASTHRPLTPDPCSSAPPQRPALATHVAGSFPPSWHADSASQPTWRLPTKYPIRKPHWRQGRKVGQDRYCMRLRSYDFFSSPRDPFARLERFDSSIRQAAKRRQRPSDGHLQWL